MSEILFGLDGTPRMVTERAAVTIQLERVVDKRTVFEETGYVALKTRPATADEVDKWRFGE